jgi:hypothetical protein
LNFEFMIEKEDRSTLRGRLSGKHREIPALFDVGRIFDTGVADQAAGMFGEDEIAGANTDGAAEGFDGNTCPGMEGGHRVAHVLKAHESLGVHGALHAVNDLIGSDNAQRS